jgi:L-ascorbate metabolism protein UlaG (beta-lactamase superfamily)
MQKSLRPMTPSDSPHFNGKTFSPPGHAQPRGWREVLRWKLSAAPRPWPRAVDVSPEPTPAGPTGSACIVTWIGHSTFLLRTRTLTFLTDPVFSNRAGPLGWFGPRRVHPPGLALGALPPVDVVLLSHDHYDHWDAPTLRTLVRRHDPLFVAPLRHTDLLRQIGARHQVELDWWQTHLVRGARITLTPAQHWSNRIGRPRNHRLWGGYFVTVNTGGDSRETSAAERSFWFAGDSGYHGALFDSIRARCGRPELALLPIGAYEPRWFMAPVHMNPAEAVMVHRQLEARLSLAMHWGTFRLTDEGREDPLRELERAKQAQGVAVDAFRALTPGASTII